MSPAAPLAQPAAKLGDTDERPVRRVTGPRRRSPLAMLLCLVLSAGVAHAENAKLDAARRAIRDVRYDDARALLVEALDRGSNAPGELIEIYELSAATAMVLGEGELAERYYRRALALEPAAQLPPDASPKLRRPFVAAQAYMAAHGRLDARVAWRGRQVEVTVVADPLEMVAALATRVGDASWQRVPLAGPTTTIASLGATPRVALLDEHGNILRELAVPVAPAEAPAAPVRAPAPPRPSWLRRWTTWALPAAVLGGTGIGFAVSAQRARNRFNTIIADGDHFFEDAEDQRKRWRTDARVADVLLVASGAFAAAAIVTAVIPPRARDSAVRPLAAPSSVGLAWMTRF